MEPTTAGAPASASPSASASALPGIAVVADELIHLGFLLISPFPPGATPSRLLVALREEPTQQHFDPELVRYWRTGQDHRGHPEQLDIGSRTPLVRRFAWGKI